MRHPASQPLHAAFLVILPRIELHGRIRFRHLPPVMQEEVIAEMVALAWMWFTSTDAATTEVEPDRRPVRTPARAVAVPPRTNGTAIKEEETPPSPAVVPTERPGLAEVIAEAEALKAVLKDAYSGARTGPSRRHAI